MHVKADVCVQQAETPSAAVTPEEVPKVPEQPVRPQGLELVPAEERETPKVRTYDTTATLILDSIVLLTTHLFNFSSSKLWRIPMFLLHWPQYLLICTRIYMAGM